MTRSDTQPLAGLRVLDLSTVVAGPFGTDILTALGAEVIRVSPPGGGMPVAPRDPDEMVSDADGFLFGLQRGKKSINLNLKSAADQEKFLRLVEVSDVVYDNFRPGVMARLGIDHPALAKVNPRIIACSISGYGSTGPWAGVGAYDVTVQALSGGMSITGSNDSQGMPCRWGVPIGDITGAFYAVIGILAALDERARTGRGQAIDISLFDGQLALNTYRVPQAFGAGVEFGAPEPRRGGAGTVPYGPFLCGDGKWIVIGIASNFWKRFCEAVGLEDLIEDPRFVSLAKRQDNQGVLEPIIEEKLLTASSDHWQEKLIEAHVPVGKVNSIREAFEQPQAQAREMIATLDGPGGEGVRTAANPIRFVGEPKGRFTAPVSEGSDDGIALEPLPAVMVGLGEVDARIAGLAAIDGPLRGLLVLELCGDEPSGTFGTQLLADLGATVVKVERPPGEGANCEDIRDLRISPEIAYYFGLNRNKRSICLDLKSASGREIFLKLARHADVVYDNYKGGVMDRLGLDPDALKAVKPDIITCSVSGFGKTGPWSHLPAYDATIQALGGGMSITGTGEPGPMPVRCGNPIGGIAGAFYAVIAVLSALRRRRASGSGAMIDIALLDTQLAMHAYRVAPALSGREYPALQRRGGSGAVPYGPFQCADGKWFVLGITGQFWPAAARLFGHAEWIDDSRFATEQLRQDNEGELNDLVAAVMARESADVWQRRFVELGIPGATVNTIKEAYAHPHVELRKMLVSFDHPLGGRLKVAGSPLKLSAHEFRGFRHAPALGEDTVELLTQIVGIAPGDLKPLRESKAIWWSDEGPRYDRPSVV
ncbi:MULTISPECIES: CoA transferase [unclassified Chelatococcus]|uniref:CaiB/BaiF CoA transferase family protein n=1 Tax=unclassified Chelatococcus TaxID=2638111 RepID=UPI001BCAD8DB|nr:MULTISPECIES: CoA transferase [unclassified Chelatococcus]MBS7699945.1 CoA transferase [Chelatococcus sp. YT9]MBX3558630.1 CoA transferase [Chelatococcus sp.]